MDIVCASDRAYLPGLVPMLRSLRAQCGDAEHYRVWLLDGGIPVDLMPRLRDVLAPIGFEVIRPKRQLRDLPCGEHYSEVAYFRLLIPEALPKEVSRVLYLDTDVIVTASLAELETLPFDRNPILAAQCSVIREMGHPKALRNFAELGFSRDHPYFNSGVLVMDLDRFRSEGLSEQVFDYLRKHPTDVRWLDQDALNAVTGRRWGRLARRFNFEIDPWSEVAPESVDAVRKIQQGHADRPAIVHFLSAWKPWHVDYRHPAGAIYRAYADPVWPEFEPLMRATGGP